MDLDNYHILLFLLGVVLGVTATWLWLRQYIEQKYKNIIERDYIHQKAFSKLEQQLEQSQSKEQAKDKEIRDLSMNLSAKEQSVLHLREKFLQQEELFAQNRREMEDRFSVLAEKLLEEKSQKFTEQNKLQLDNLLSPFKEKFKEFETQIEKRYWEESKERISLQQEIHQLRDLNVQLSQDANSLVSALKGDNKTQGDWGEFRLEVLLEKAGLQKDIHFSTQQSWANEKGQQLRPDVIIHLPHEKHLVIDSKVSLKAYDAYFQAETAEEKATALAAHVSSIQAHIKNLKSKNYTALHQIQSPDYLLMYIPIEPALTLALQHNGSIFLDALDKDIVLVSNTTLLATMRTVSFIWKQEKQKRNVLEIARQSGLLYDKFCSFTNDLRDVGRRLSQAQSSYDNAVRKLSDSTKYGDTLIGRAEKIKELGAKTNKKLSSDF